MKSSFIITVIASVLLVPALFADTTGTGTTTSTGTTSTGVTSTGTTGTGTTGTGTTGTGTTGTGTTGTGTTGTGVQCNTGTVVSNQAALMTAQLAFSTEIARLVNVKQSVYSGAQTLTGTARVEAMKSANIAFRTGFMTAIKTLNTVKKSNRSHHSEVRECKKEIRQEKREDRHEDREDKKEHKEEIKSQVKDLKDRIKEMRKNNRDRASGQSSGRR